MRLLTTTAAAARHGEPLPYPKRARRVLARSFISRPLDPWRKKVKGLGSGDEAPGGLQLPRDGVNG